MAVGDAVLSGQGGTVAIGSALVDVKRFTINLQVDEKDITVLGSAGWKDWKACLKSWDGDVDVISMATHSDDLVGSTLAGTFVTSSETGSQTFVGSVLVLKVSPNVPYDDIDSWKLTFKGRKVLTCS